MAIVRKSNPLTNVISKGVAEKYEEFLQTRKNFIAEETYKIYEELGKRYIVPKLTLLTKDNLDALTGKHMREFLDDYASLHTNGGTAFIHRHVRTFVNWYWNEYDIPAPNPMKKVQYRNPKTKPIQGVTRSQVDKLLAVAKDRSHFPERDIAIIMVLCDTGIRKSSLVEMRMRDVDLRHGQITVFEKDQQYHVKSFGNATGKAIRAYLNCLDDCKPDDPFWIKMDGCAITHAGVREVLRRLANEAGIAYQSFHDFRRFYGLELYKSTHDIYFVSRALDHKSIEVTKRYLAIDQFEDLDAIRAVSPMDRKIGQTGITVNRK